MNVPILGRFLDERFFTHRLRSTSIAGVTGAILAIALFAYHFYVDHVSMALPSVRCCCRSPDAAG